MEENPVTWDQVLLCIIAGLFCIAISRIIDRIESAESQVRMQGHQLLVLHDAVCPTCGPVETVTETVSVDE